MDLRMDLKEEHEMPSRCYRWKLGRRGNKEDKVKLFKADLCQMMELQESRICDESKAKEGLCIFAGLRQS